MRHYIRHPFDAAIRYTLAGVSEDCGKSLKNVSAGGLCFHSEASIPKDSLIHIEIPINTTTFEVDGIVVWCHEHDGFEIGVRFTDDSKTFALRMVEQMCHIKHYKDEIKRSENRVLSTEEAADEWITKYAKVFPH